MFAFKEKPTRWVMLSLPTYCTLLFLLGVVLWSTLGVLQWLPVAAWCAGWLPLGYLGWRIRLRWVSVDLGRKTVRMVGAPLIFPFWRCRHTLTLSDVRRIRLYNGHRRAIMTLSTDRADFVLVGRDVKMHSRSLLMLLHDRLQRILPEHVRFTI